MPNFFGTDEPPERVRRMAWSITFIFLVSRKDIGKLTLLTIPFPCASYVMLGRLSEPAPIAFCLIVEIRETESEFVLL